MGGGQSRLHRRCVRAAVTALAVIALAACSRGGEVREATQIRPPPSANTPAAELIVAQGGRILRDIAEARAEVHRGYSLPVERDIDRADRMLDVIEESMPTAEVRQRIWVARRHLEYAEIQEVKSDLVPIYVALERVESLVPADSIRRHLDRANRHLENGDRKAAERQLARADQELLFVDVDLPLSSTRRHLAEAREALALGDHERTDADLQRAESDLAFLTGFARSPLESARWSLSEAAAACTSGDFEGAERYVTLARQSVERASDDASEPSPRALNEVVDALRGVEGRLATHRADALDTLDRLVARVRTLAHTG